MAKVNIFLRSIENEGRKRLSMYDSHGNGNIDNLVTEVNPGDTIYWRLDCNSNLQGIEKIYAKNTKGDFFGEFPKKGIICKYWKLKIPHDAKGEESYGIDYVLCDGKRLSIDPYIKVVPPIP